MRHILVAVSGETPQIITETLWALTQSPAKIAIDEIHVLTTARGAERINTELLHPDNGEMWKLCRDYGIAESSVKCSPETIHVLRGEDNQPLDDLRSSADSRAARDQIFALIQELTSEPDVCVHGSIAGGRKSMSFLLGSAFHFFSRPPSETHPGDRLYHILVSPMEVERTPAFYYLPRQERHFDVKGVDGVVRQLSSADIHIELAELSCLSLRDLLTFRDGNDYETIYQRAQEEIRHHQTLKAENEDLRRRVGVPTQFLLGRSHGMRQVWGQIQACADLDIVTLILGETGVGKELVAREIHTQSSRRNGPFHSVNCGAFPENLLEAELFGSMKGAYTGADKERIGAFRSAKGGTLFLDEIGELSPKGQSALLQVLQDRWVHPVGSDQKVDISDVKVVAATNRDLNELIEEQAFRQDLYYRINGYSIAVPPLRLRQEDIPLLVEGFVQQYNQKHQREVVGLAEEAMESLRGYSWPGNVRELAHVVERLVIHARRGAVNIRPEDLPSEIRKPVENQRLLLEQALEKPLKEGQDLFNKLRITRALAQSGGSITLAARALGVTRQGLTKAIRNLGLESA